MLMLLTKFQEKIKNQINFLSFKGKIQIKSLKQLNIQDFFIIEINPRKLKIHKKPNIKKYKFQICNLKTH